MAECGADAGFEEASSIRDPVTAAHSIGFQLWRWAVKRWNTSTKPHAASASAGSVEAQSAVTK